MRRKWPHSPCIALFVLAILGPGAAVSAQFGNRQDGGSDGLVHRLEKARERGRAQITGHRERREAGVCPSDYSLCPASLNGGCCPHRYGCATDACYATTAGTGTACNLKGYYSCGLEDGFGCCPEGYVCGATDCTAAAGVSNVMTSCPASYYLCPASVNYGCCLSGFGCAANACYRTQASTYTITETVTTTNADSGTVTTTLTATTVMTPTPPTALPTSSDANAVAKFVPTKVDKVVASSAPSSDDDGGGGLTKAQLGGIIAGAVVMFIIIVVLGVIIIRRLNRVADAIDSRRESSAGGGGQSKASHPPGAAQYGKLAPSDVDASGDEPPNHPYHHTNGNGRRGGRSARDRSNSDYSTSQQPTPYNFPSGATLSDSGDGQGGYFDIPARSHNMPGHHHPHGAAAGGSTRPSIDSQATSAMNYPHNQHQQQQQQQQQQFGRRPSHGRHFSNASEQSAASSDAAAAGVGSPLIPAELGVDGGYIPELPAALAADGQRWSGGGGPSPRASLSHARRRSEGHARGRSDSSASGTGTPVPPGGGGGVVPLGVVNEAVEFLHGYYGPRDERVGQTATGLDDGRARNSVSPRPR